jgi:hypothetical protein
MFPRLTAVGQEFSMDEKFLRNSPSRFSAVKK